MILLRLISWPYVRRHALRTFLTTLGVVLNMVPLQGDLAAAHAYGLDYGYADGRAPVDGPDAETVLPMSTRTARPQLTGRGA